MYRIRNRRIEVFLAHPGGPFWETKDKGAWTIPKGQFFDGRRTARGREARVSGRDQLHPRTVSSVSLGTIRQLSGKLVEAWAFEGDCNPTNSAASPARWSGRRDPSA